MKYYNRFVGLERDVEDVHGLVESIMDAVATEYQAAAQYFLLMDALSQMGRPDLSKVVFNIFKEELEHAGELSAVVDEIVGAIIKKKFSMGYDEARRVMSGFKEK